MRFQMYTLGFFYGLIAKDYETFYNYITNIVFVPIIFL